MSRVAVVSTGPIDDHDTGRRHPESRARLAAADRGVERARLGDDLVRVEPRAATRAELERAHDPAYLDALEAFVRDGGGAIDADTRASAGSWSTALAAAGAGLVAIDALAAGDADAAFVCVRPPGHHALRARAMGFCLINSVAVAASKLVADGERVLVVDWDVHHGNGTEAIFWDEPSVAYVSTHESPFYPGTGSASDTGGAGAPGTVWNFELQAGATGDVALTALDDVVAPAMAAFAPTWVLVSCGFDAHRADPLADLAWSAGDFALLTRRVRALAPSGGTRPDAARPDAARPDAARPDAARPDAARSGSGPGNLVLFLEGGYDLDALERCTAVTLATLAGADADVTSTDGYEPPTSGGPGMESVARTAAAHGRHG